MTIQPEEHTQNELTPLGGGTVDYSVDDGFGAITEERTSRKLDAGTILFIGVVVAAVVSLWSMRTLGKTNAAEFENPDAVKDVRNWVWNRTNDEFATSIGGLEVINQLDKNQLNQMQVPVSSLRNQTPFRFVGEGPLVVTPVDTSGFVNPRDALLDAWEGVIDDIGEQMTISVILAPNTPRAQAVLDGNRIMIGDVVYVDHNGDEYPFTIESIGQKGVVFYVKSTALDHERRISVDLKRGW
jgi:hypothetical protein